jgi:DMSO/TMAO reductase YedYZ heme-binding membrane subunit
VSPHARARWTSIVLILGGLAAAGLSAVGLPPGPPQLDAGLVAHVTGLLAGHLAPILLLLMARTPWLERRIGSDVLARWHRRSGPLFVGLMLAHAVAAVQAWASTRGQNLLTALLSVVGLPGLGAATAATGLFLTVAAVSAGAVRRRLSFEAWHGVHLLAYVAVVLAFLHELAGPNLAGQPAIQVAWTLLHAYALAMVTRFRVLAPLENTWRHRMRVVAVVPETNGVVSIVYLPHGRAQAGDRHLKFHESRDNLQVRGNIYYSAKDVRANRLNGMGIVYADWYDDQALVPPMPWIDAAAPTDLSAVIGSAGTKVRWRAGDASTIGYAVYRIPLTNKRIKPNDSILAGAHDPDRGRTRRRDSAANETTSAPRQLAPGTMRRPSSSVTAPAPRARACGRSPGRRTRRRTRRAGRCGSAGSPCRRR